MKKKLAVMTAAAAMALVLGACGTSAPEESGQAASADAQAVSADAAQTETAEQAEEESADANTVSLPEEVPTEFYFASGVGAWSTDLTLHKDGTFFGDYHDSDMGDTGDGYPNGTVYVSSFSGAFTNIQQIDAYTYEMTLSDVQTDEEEGVENIIDEIRYVSSSAYGLETGSTCYLYLPGTPKDSLSEDCLMWVHMDFFDENDNLTCYLIYNQEPGYTFIGDNTDYTEE